MSGANVASQPEVTQDERTMAVLAHALQMVGSWIAPLIIFIMKRKSRFVAFHALQALFLQIVFLLIWIIGITIFVATMFATIAVHPQGTQPAVPPPQIFILFPLFWLIAMGMWVCVLICTIVYSLKAGRGEWAGYPLISGLVRRVLKMS